MSALAGSPLADAYIPPGVDGDTRVFIEGIHAFNVWRVLEEARQNATAGGS